MSRDEDLPAFLVAGLDQAYAHIRETLHSLVEMMRDDDHDLPAMGDLARALLEELRDDPGAWSTMLSMAIHELATR